MQKSSHFRAGGTWKISKDAQAIADAAAELRLMLDRGDLAASVIRQAIVLTEEPIRTWENEGGSVED